MCLNSRNSQMAQKGLTFDEINPIYINKQRYYDTFDKGSYTNYVESFRPKLAKNSISKSMVEILD